MLDPIELAATGLLPPDVVARLTGLNVTELMARHGDEIRRLRGEALLFTLAGHFTLGEQAVLTAVAYEVNRRGVCALTWGEIGRRAGLGRDLVRRALHKARRLGLLTIEERRQGWLNRANVVRLLDPLWQRWLARRKAAEARKAHGG